MNEHIQRLLDHPHRVPATVGVIAFAGGLGLGYILGKRQTETVEQYTYEIDVEEEDDLNQIAFDFSVNDVIEEVRQTRKVVIDEAVHKSLNEGEQVVTDIPQVVDKEEFEEDEPEIVMSNVFAESDDTWDYEFELENRREDAPHILHKDEFYADEKNYMQSTLTFYEGDRVLVVEEDETPLYNLSEVTGMLRFGHGSGDPNVVYIRNDKRRAEYEVLRHEGHYAHEVLGLDIEERSNTRDLRHSRLSKFKDD